MSPSGYTEDTLVQQTTANYLEEELGWESVYAYNQETFGPDGLLGRDNDTEIVLTLYLREKLVAFNPGLPDETYEEAIRIIVTSSSSQTTLSTNKEKYELFKNGVPVTYRNKEGERKKEHLRVFNFKEPEGNHFICVRELWVRGELYRRRADIVGFVNGIPLLFIECKNVHKDLRNAYEKNFKDYIHDNVVPHLFHHNAFVVLGNGIRAKVGSITSKYEHFNDWKRLSEDEPGEVDMETLLKGVCDKTNFIDLFENFILFDDSSGKLAKIVSRNHQYLGVNKAIAALSNRRIQQGKLGVFWHTQGSGKSYSIVFFTRKVHRRLGGNFTFLVLTDREDLDTQIFKTFAGCGLVDNDRDPCRASNGDHLKELLGQHKAYVFSLVQKFNKDVDPSVGYSLRDDIVVITDEAHRTQYGSLSLNLRNALPNASFIGFTGTPLFKDDEITRRVFGNYVSTYDFQRAVDDEATVPLFYDARGDKLGIATNDLNEKVAAKIEELEIDDVDVQQRLERDLKREYHVITSEKRLKTIARDFVDHYSRSWESGKAMLICIDKVTCVRMFEYIRPFWNDRIAALKKSLKTASNQQEEIHRMRQINWMEQTQFGVIISEEQGEQAKFEKWDLDITPHRKLMKEGFEIPEAMRSKPEFSNIQRLDADDAFKEDEHPFRVAIVCAMWLTGFDVPSLATLYLDKPLKAHTLMQAIARANRVAEGKNNGMIVDYCGILKNLRKALATFGGKADGGRSGDDEIEPAKPEDELLADLVEAIAFVKRFLRERKAPLKNVIGKTGFKRNAAILLAKEAANENDESRKTFEIMCREVFKKFKACINLREVNEHKKEHDAISIIYKSLQKDTDAKDISFIIRELHKIADETITVELSEDSPESKTYDISKIDFDLLRQEFERSRKKNTTVQSLRHVIDQRLQILLSRNPLRTDYQRRYEEIVAEYNREKDRPTIERTFEDLMRFVRDMDEEESRSAREGLDEESLAIFDLIRKPELTAGDIAKIKKISVELLNKLKSEKLTIDHWRDKEATRDAVRSTIKDFLWSDDTGLPIDTFNEEDVGIATDEIFRHVFRAYPYLPSPVYSAA